MAYVYLHNLILMQERKYVEVPCFARKRNQHHFHSGSEKRLAIPASDPRKPQVMEMVPAFPLKHWFIKKVSLRK